MNAVAARMPIAVVASGALAGLLAALVLSLLVRVVPGLQDLTRNVNGGHGHAKSRPAAPAPFTPEGALTRAQGPGPEGSAALFAAKVGSGLFGTDLRNHARLCGKLVHVLYGSAWGVAYALVQASYGLHWWLAGTLHGLLVWALGPAWLVPAMRLMLSPGKLGPWRATMVVAGHVAYGLTVAICFRWLHQARVP